jgi:hypothetical protein
MTQNAAETTAVYNVRTLRAQIERYKSEHDGAPPVDLSRLTLKTNRHGTTDPAAGPAAYGPYLCKIPSNPLVPEDVATLVKPPGAIPPAASENDAGWLYDPVSGEVWINHDDFLSR